MFFNKKAEQLPVRTAVETLHWGRASSRSQSTRVIIKSWSIKLLPMLKYPAGCKVEVSFEGGARLGTTPRVPVYGEIEIPIDLEPPNMLSDYWTNVPECVNGHASMSLDGVPQLFMTLYCTSAAMEWVQRVCTAGFSCAGSTLDLDITLGYPDEITDEFWHTRWQSEKLLIHTWKVQAGADRDLD